jgi:hypothetical protein
MLAVHPVAAACGQELELPGWQPTGLWPLQHHLTIEWAGLRPSAEAAAA